MNKIMLWVIMIIAFSLVLILINGNIPDFIYNSQFSIIFVILLFVPLVWGFTKVFG
jgi:hypothetical protein